MLLNYRKTEGTGEQQEAKMVLPLPKYKHQVRQRQQIRLVGTSSARAGVVRNTSDVVRQRNLF